MSIEAKIKKLEERNAQVTQLVNEGLTDLRESKLRITRTLFD